MSKQQPEAQRLAEMLTADEWPGNVTLVSYARECVAELLRQHAENETLRVGYAAARLEIESLKAQLHAAKQINAAQFGLLAASIPGSALRASHGQAPAGATEEVENLRKALVYAAFALHDTPQYMLAQGITLIDGDTVRVSRDGWTVEASVNPHRQPAPAAQQAGECVAEPRNAIDRDALIDAIAQGLRGTWHCTRVWEAWHIGTMSQDDFEPVDESETPTEIADAVLALLAAPGPADAPHIPAPEPIQAS